MIDCISVENMRQSDAYTIENFVLSLELMYRAAYGVFESADWHGKIAIIAGSGNNGGDGYALACILKDQGYDCTVYFLGHRLTADSLHYAQIAKGMGVNVLPFDLDCLSGWDIVVDCLLGTGFKGNVRADYRAAIEKINDSSAFVISVDINSGMNGDTGEAEAAVRSDLTVTIGYVKNGLIANAAGKYIKRLVCVDIGIILAQKENTIYSSTEWEEFCVLHRIDTTNTTVCCDGRIHFCCPAWLEM